MIHYTRLEEGVHTFKVDGYITILVQPGTCKIHWHAPSHCQLTQATLLAKTNRYACSCDPAIMNDDRLRFSQQIILELPDRSRDKVRRITQGLSPAVSIDPCIVEAIKYLWGHGIETTGCCCGHNIMRGWVSVHEKDYVRMFELGYEQRPVEVPNPGVVLGLYTFFL